jgi:hypothetical protein
MAILAAEESGQFKFEEGAVLPEEEIQALGHTGLADVVPIRPTQYDERETEYMALAEKPGMHQTAMFLLWIYRNNKAGYGFRMPLPIEPETDSLGY